MRKKSEIPQIQDEVFEIDDSMIETGRKSICDTARDTDKDLITQRSENRESVFKKESALESKKLIET